MLVVSRDLQDMGWNNAWSIDLGESVETRAICLVLPSLAPWTHKIVESIGCTTQKSSISRILARLSSIFTTTGISCCFISLVHVKWLFPERLKLWSATHMDSLCLVLSRFYFSMEEVLFVLVKDFDSLLQRLGCFFKVLSALIVQLETLVATRHVVVHHYFVSRVNFDWGQLVEGKWDLLNLFCVFLVGIVWQLHIKSVNDVVAPWTELMEILTHHVASKHQLIRCFREPLASPFVAWVDISSKEIRLLATTCFWISFGGSLVIFGLDFHSLFNFNLKFFKFL